jgi:heat shock protein HslJ
MMCDEPVMAQERAVLGILESTTGFAVADDGSLTLNGGDGRTISASRTDDP